MLLLTTSYLSSALRSCLSLSPYLCGGYSPIIRAFFPLQPPYHGWMDIWIDGYMNGWMDCDCIICMLCIQYNLLCYHAFHYCCSISLSCLLPLDYWILQHTYPLPHPPTLWCDMLSPIAGNEFCQEVVYNELPPIKAKLNSGVAITETISCKEYQYYTMDGDAYY